MTTAEYAVLFVVIVVATLFAWTQFAPALAGLFGDDYASPASTQRSGGGLAP